MHEGRAIHVLRGSAKSRASARLMFGIDFATGPPMRSALASVIFLLLGCVGLGCSNGPLVDDASSDAIVNGSATASDHPAVGYLVTSDGKEHCTGTLIAPDVVLTAAHCFNGPAELWFGIGKIGAAGATVYTPVASGGELAPYAFVHPGFQGGNHDLAYIVLSQPVTGVTPATVGDYRSGDACDFDAVGYGRSTAGAADLQSGFDGERKTARMCARDIDASSGFLKVVGQDGSVCTGDSGGGLIRHGATGDVVVATVHGAATPNARCDTGITVFYQPLVGEEAFIREALAASRQSGSDPLAPPMGPI